MSGNLLLAGLSVGLGNSDHVTIPNGGLSLVILGVSDDFSPDTIGGVLSELDHCSVRLGVLGGLSAIGVSLDAESSTIVSAASVDSGATIVGVSMRIVILAKLGNSLADLEVGLDEAVLEVLVASIVLVSSLALLVVKNAEVGLEFATDALTMVLDSASRLTPMALRPPSTPSLTEQ
jgi:hypothetical protein